MAQSGSPLRISLKVLGILLLAVLLLIAAVALILAKPDQESQTPQETKTLLNASPAIEAQTENDLVDLISAFPAPVMSFMSGSGMTFVSALSSDAAVSGGFGRIANLYWQTGDGFPLILQTVWPADALSLLEKGFHFSTASGPTLFGKPSVRMEKEDLIRIHTATDEALYVLLLPRSLGSQIPAVCSSLQLFTVRSGEE